jgi:hypothetical protein
MKDLGFGEEYDEALPPIELVQLAGFLDEDNDEFKDIFLENINQQYAVFHGMFCKTISEIHKHYLLHSQTTIIRSSSSTTTDLRIAQRYLALQSLLFTKVLSLVLRTALFMQPELAYRHLALQDLSLTKVLNLIPRIAHCM